MKEESVSVALLRLELASLASFLHTMMELVVVLRSTERIYSKEQSQKWQMPPG